MNNTRNTGFVIVTGITTYYDTIRLEGTHCKSINKSDFKDGERRTIIVHKEKLKILALGAREFDVPHVAPLAVDVLHAPGLQEHSATRPSQLYKTRLAYLVGDPGGAALGRVAVDIRLDQAVLEGVGRPVLLQELFLELGSLHAPGFECMQIKSQMDIRTSPYLLRPTTNPKSESSFARSSHVRMRSSLVPWMPPVSVCARSKTQRGRKHNMFAPGQCRRTRDPRRPCSALW